MPAPFLTRGLWAIGIGALALALTAVALPYVASTKIVRDRIALEMSAWSGYKVSIGAAPHINIWPDFGATLTDVTLSSWDGSSADPVIAAERIEIELSALDALRGNVVFSQARFVRPTLRLQRSRSGLYLPPLPGGGRLARAIDEAQALIAENRDKPDTSRLSAVEFGVIGFEDGRIIASSANGDDIATGVTGVITWPALNRPGSLSAKGVWHGEAVTLDLGAANPLLLFGGAIAPLSLSVKSAPANVSFVGSANLAERSYVDGKAVFSAPSLPRLFEWSNVGLPKGADIGSVQIESHLSGDDQRLKMSDTSLSLNGNKGIGALDLNLTGDRPLVSGTLDFASLDLMSLLSAFIPRDAGHAAARTPGFAQAVNLDMRLSADKASAGSLTMVEIAATAQINDGFAAFDISDATALDGTIQAGLRIDRKPENPQVELRFLATDIDGAALGTAAGMTHMVPSGKATISVILKGPGPTSSFLEHANGTLSANFGPGSLSGFDLDSFAARIDKSGFFGLADVSGGTLRTDGIDLKASVANGIAMLDRAEVRSDRGTIALFGIVSYVGRGLALTGTILPPAQAQPAGDAAPTFFVGGTWDSPFISRAPSVKVEE